MKLVIDRSKWLRGEGSEASYLLRKTDGKQCCVGILCSALEISKERLGGVTDIRTFKKLFPSKALPGWLLEEVAHVEGSNSVPDIFDAYRFNDATNIAEEEREKAISEIFARHDIEVEFVG